MICTLTTRLSGHPKQYSSAVVEKQTAGDFPRQPPSEYRLALGPEVGSSTAVVLLTFHPMSKRRLLMLLVFTYLFHHLFWHASHIWACLCNSTCPKKGIWRSWIVFHDERLWFLNGTDEIITAVGLHSWQQDYCSASALKEWLYWRLPFPLTRLSPPTRVFSGCAAHHLICASWWRKVTTLVEQFSKSFPYAHKTTYPFVL